MPPSCSLAYFSAASADSRSSGRSVVAPPSGLIRPIFTTDPVAFVPGKYDESAAGTLLLVVSPPFEEEPLLHAVAASRARGRLARARRRCVRVVAIWLLTKGENAMRLTERLISVLLHMD